MLPNLSKVQRVKHLAALPWGEMAAFMAELRDKSRIAAVRLNSPS